MQQVQPAFIIAVMQSQQAWIISQQALSPLVQVIVQPSSVISHLHMPMTRLQQQAIMPFIIMQQEHMPPASIVQRFWSIPADIVSSQVQVIFMPPAHFSIVILQRGIIIIPWPAGIPAGAPIPIGPAEAPAIIPGIPIIVDRSIIIVAMSSLLVGSRTGPPGPSTGRIMPG